VIADTRNLVMDLHDAGTTVEYLITQSATATADTQTAVDSSSETTASPP
jgi:hypothetical protein